MYNAACKMVLGVAVAGLMFSCGPSAQERHAAELLGEAQAKYDLKDYHASMTALDSLDARCAEVLDVRRKGMELRARNMEALTMVEIPRIDSMRCVAQLAVDSLAPHFVEITNNVGLESYYVPKGSEKEFGNVSGIQPRVSQEGLFYIAANVQGRRIGLRTLDFGGAATKALAPDRVIEVEGSEIASYLPEDVEDVATWVLATSGPLSLDMVGEKGKVSVKIPAAGADRIRTAVHYADARQALRTANIRREQLERRLQIARDQAAALAGFDDKDKSPVAE